MWIGERCFHVNQKLTPYQEAIRRYLERSPSMLTAEIYRLSSLGPIRQSQDIIVESFAAE
jgi:hypothetical protein